MIDYNDILPELKELTIEEYINSLYETNEDGTYRFTGDTEDLRLILKDIWISKNERVKKEVIKVNNDWYRLEAYRIDNTEVEDVCGNTMIEGDKLYIDGNAEFINFSNEEIYFMRVDNMAECDEMISVPKAFERGVIDLYSTIRERDEYMLYFAWFYHSMFMEEDEIIERFMANEYEYYEEYTVDDYYKDRWDSEMNHRAYMDMESDNNVD